MNDLNVRLAPSLSAPRLLDGDTPVILDTGDLVLVLDGPVVADDIRWFAIAAEDDPGFYAGPITVAWTAGGTETDPWIEADETGLCATQPTFADLVAMAGITRLGCFGSAPLAIEAYQAAHAPDAGLGGACGVEPPLPAWLMCDNINYNWVNKDGGTDWSFLLHFDPATGIPETDLAPVGTVGPRLRITGHFDDRAAEDCVSAADPRSTEAMSQWLTCATEFVVETIEPAT